MNRIDMFQHFVDTVLPTDNRQIRWLIGWIALSLGIGFWTADATTDNYTALKEFAPVLVWAMLFIAYGFEKLLGCVVQLPFKVVLGFSVIGLYLWGYVFISFVMFDNSDVQATEYMLMFPLITELWVVSKLIFDVVYINYYSKS
jgi:hypothetical protein